MTELMKALTDLVVEATIYLKRKNGEPVQPSLPLAAAAPAQQPTEEDQRAAAMAAGIGRPLDKSLAAEPKKERKARTTKEKAPEQAPAQPPAAEKPAEKPAEAPKKEMTPQEQLNYMVEVSKRFLAVYDKDEPNGMVLGKQWMLERYKATKMQEIPQDKWMDWAQFLEGKIQEHK